jgi:hypothetical protein
VNFDPEELFVDVMDFYSILLLDVLLTWLLMGEIGPVVFGDRYA